MVMVTGTTQQESWRKGVLPPVERVRPGIWSIPVPMPGSPLRYVLCYLFETDPGPVLVDPGWPADESWNALVAGLAALGCQPRDVIGVLITHAHADHSGLAGRVAAESGCWVAMHPREIVYLKESRDRLMATCQLAWHDLCGVPDAERKSLNDDVSTLAEQMRPFVSQPLEDGERPDVPGWDIRPVWTPGHTPGHLCYAVPGQRVLLTGDHLLPRITSNVGVYPGEQDRDPLTEYLGSLELLHECDGIEALPAHEYRFAGIPDRTEAVAAHHEQRLDEAHWLLAVGGPLSAWEVAAQLKWSRDWPELNALLRRFAIGEALAHLMCLTNRGRAVPGAGDRPRWSAVMTGQS
jgi:glyoxylase-like metal-dependent hydrolase (beta-lactamase superfamily II)